MTTAMMALALMTLAPRAGQGAPDADIILVGGAVHTMEKGAAATALAVRDGRVIYVGDEAGAVRYRGASTRWIDTHGGAVLPGLVDAHGHLRNLGRALTRLRLNDAPSKERVVEMVREAARELPPERWIQGRGWDQNKWPVQEFPTWRDLEGVAPNPVFLRRVDGHASWVNRAALEIAGVTADTPDPPGGRIVRDDQGEPTGALIDRASDLVREHIPAESADELDDIMSRAIRRCNELGLTGVQDAGTNEAMLASLRRLARRGALTLRVYAMVDADEAEELADALAAGPSSEADGYLDIRAIKAYADGALGSRGAALLEPYDDEPGNRGLLLSTPEELESLARRAVEAGFQMCTHAIGDRGTRVVLDAYEAALAGRDGDFRFRVEHAQVVSGPDVARFADLGVIPSMQPTHCTSDMPWAVSRIGAERAAGAYAWRTLLDDGNVLAFGSDFPVESPNPLWGIYAAVTRQDHEGNPEGGWYPVQRLTVEEAVRAFTVGAAYASFRESERGTIAVGRTADLTVLDRDIFSCTPRDILATRVTHTIVGGAVVYEAGE